ncbi:unnamed protein product [Linum trigynum]|uniref:Uncharacterized protein n=1 Tax=Linum trigynum TaxID=586398 RepID=A0AAV2G757_9ROSI
MDKQQQQKHGKEIVTVKDIMTNKYDVIVTALESLTESTERLAAASRDSTGAIEALGGRITISIEEMGKSVTENLCRALAETMREVLVGVLKSKESVPEAPPTEANGASAAEAAAAVGEVMAQGGATGGGADGSSGAAAAAVPRSPRAATDRVVAEQGSATGGAAGAAITNPLGGPGYGAEIGRGNGRRRRGAGRANLQWTGSAACSNGPGDRGGPWE